MIDSAFFYVIYFKGHGYLTIKGDVVPDVERARGFKTVPDPQEYLGFITEQTGPLSAVQRQVVGRVVKVTMVVEEVDQ